MTARRRATTPIYDWNRSGWARQPAEAHLAAARAAGAEGLRSLVRSYDWDLHPEPVLGWAMGQRQVDLAGAVTAFFNGTPERFNHLHKRDVPLKFQAAALVLDNICLRVNSGFYAVAADAPEPDLRRLSEWIAGQQADRARGAIGRWALDEQIVGRLWHDGALAQPEPPGAPTRSAPPRARLGRWLAASLA
ncbi:hypothetical protein D6850_08770 [Roseovarius spongiae]|uniref:Uncharacterized protein n=1 Tax=Roseovarius spongiae TaxID=2320272 RepID=A0A3A8AV57_9RHOB|nr:hypothetical protein [Roseovarius spongiae]RKF14947.1 hypothetical protein D6850_08770 [Roseovarius spongiae]